MIMQPTGQFSLLQMSRDMLVGHLVRPSLNEISLLNAVRNGATDGEVLIRTSSVDHALPPPVEDDFL